jgi:hypothetical protein
MKPPKWHKGHPKREKGENYHHLFFHKPLYKSAFEKQFRNSVGLVIPEKIPVHDYLHMVVPPPPKFTKNEMGDCLEFLQQSKDSVDTENRFWGAEAVMRYTVFMEADSPEVGERMHDIRWNLAKQIGVMAGAHTLENPI